MYTRFLKSLALCVVSAWSPISPAHAAYIYDTGQGAAQQGGSTLRTSQYFAAQFALDSAVTIGSVEAWLGVFSPGSLTVSLHGAGGLTPGTQLHSKAVNLSTTTTAAWFGVSDLEWSVGAGTYWISLIPDSELHAALPQSVVGPDEVAVGGTSYGGGWFVPTKDYWDNTNFALRIGEAEDIEVPEPATLGLLGLGLLGLAYAQRSRRAAQV